MGTYPYTIPEMLKQIRYVARLTQKELADMLGVSKILIAKVETHTREPSGKLIDNLAEKLGVSKWCIIHFNSEFKYEELSSLEKRLVDIGNKLQKKLIIKRAEKLLK